MAQTGYTPISIYYSATTTNVPTAGNLVAGELAINTADGKLFYKDSSGVVQVIAGKGGAGVAGGSNTQVQYNSSGSLAGSANMTFNGTTFTLANDASISGLTVGKGSGTTTQSTAIGAAALSGSNSVGYNTAVGYFALQLNTSGANNTAVGNQALNVNTSGIQNTGIGSFALFSNTTGGSNNVLGQSAMYYNTTGSNNTAVGQSALQSNTTASNNTAVGYQAGYSNTTGTPNTFIGNAAGYANSTGGANTALGYASGYNNTKGLGNTFIGYQSGFTFNDTTGANIYNTFVGTNSGYSVTTGSANTFVGASNTGYGAGYLVTTGSKNTILGGYNGNQGSLDIRTSNNYCVISDGDGNPRAYWDNNGYMVSIGVYNNTTASAANVFVASNGYVLRSTSALKYKQDIRNLESIDINKFRPVRYKSKAEMDDQTKDHFGIIADEVDEAGITELVNYGADGEVEGFQYERLTVVLLKELQTLKADFDAYKATHP
jgi:hypothetical protein